MGHGVPVSEARPHADEARLGRVLLHGPPQPEEGVVLHGTLPQVLAGLGVVHAEHEGVLLLLTLGGGGGVGEVGGKGGGRVE